MSTETSAPGPLLIAYDGSPAARDAIAEAARLFPGAPALVATCWWRLSQAAAMARAGLPSGVVQEAARKLDQEAHDEALRIACEGADLARDAGLDADATTLRAQPATWTAIVQEADRRDVRAVVVGSRGRSGLRSAVLGSVSKGIVHHCRRPVVVVHPARDGEAGPPPPDITQQRTERFSISGEPAARG